jgi:hypothetical protein
MTMPSPRSPRAAIPFYVAAFLNAHRDTWPPPPDMPATLTEILRGLARRYTRWTKLSVLLAQLRDPEAPETEAELVDAIRRLRDEYGEHCSIGLRDGSARLSAAHRRLLVVQVHPGFTVRGGDVPVLLLPPGEVLFVDPVSRRPLRCERVIYTQGSVLAALMDTPYASSSAQQLTARTGVKDIARPVERLRGGLGVRMLDDPTGYGLDVLARALGTVELALDLKHGRAWRNGRPLPLRPDEFAVVARIAAGAGALVTLEAIAHAIWGPDALPARAAASMLAASPHLELPDGRFLLASLRDGYVSTQPGAVRWITGWSPDGTPALQLAPPPET